MDATEQEHLEKLQQTHIKRLRVLEQQKSRFGMLYVPPYIVTEIEELQQEIDSIDRQLGHPVGKGRSIALQADRSPANNPSPAIGCVALIIIALILLFAGIRIFSFFEMRLDTKPDSILNVGQVWRQNGTEIALNRVETSNNEIRMELNVKNNTNKSVIINFGTSRFHYGVAHFLILNQLDEKLDFEFSRTGNSSVDSYEYGYDHTDQQALQPQQSIQLYLYIDLNKISSSTREITVTVSDILEVKKAKWKALTINR